MSEPRTEAGKRLLADFVWLLEKPLAWDRFIEGVAAIEAEAHEQAAGAFGWFRENYETPLGEEIDAGPEVMK